MPPWLSHEDPWEQVETRGLQSLDYCSFLFVLKKIFFLAALLISQDLSSPTRDEPMPPAVEAQSPNDWTTREVLIVVFLL